MREVTVFYAYDDTEFYDRDECEYYEGKAFDKLKEHFLTHMRFILQMGKRYTFILIM